MEMRLLGRERYQATQLFLQNRKRICIFSWSIHMLINIFTWNVGPRPSLWGLEPLNICAMRGDHDTSEMLSKSAFSSAVHFYSSVQWPLRAHLIVHLAPSEHFWTSSRLGNVMPRMTERRITARLSPASIMTTIIIFKSSYSKILHLAAVVARVLLMDVTKKQRGSQAISFSVDPKK